MIVVFTVIWNGASIPLAFRSADRTTRYGYYDSLVTYLDTLPRPLRIEVVPTRTFAQADTLALRIDGIARGWETQLDRLLNPEFYTGRLDAETYHRWLRDRGVSVVALPLGTLYDRSEDEAAVIRSKPAYLREVMVNDDWKVYAVVDATPLVDNGATVVDVQADELAIDASADRMDDVEVQVHRHVRRVRRCRLSRAQQRRLDQDLRRAAWADPADDLTVDRSRARTSATLP